MKLLIKIAGSLIGAVLLLLAGAVASLSLPSVQQRIKTKALELISETLGTKVTLNDAGFSFTNGSIALYGLNIDDQQGQSMLAIDTLYTNLDMWQAYKTRDVELEGVTLNGLKANLYKEKGDTATNYQFLLDSIAARKHEHKDGVEHKAQLTFDINHASISNLDLSWHDRNKPGDPQKLKLGNLELENMQQDGYHITIDQLTYATNNGKPRKNTGKPNRGAFDAGHLDLVVNCDLTAHTITKDTVNITMHNLWGEDRGSGLVADSVAFKGTLAGGKANLSDIRIKSRHTRLAFDKATLTLPDSTHKFAYSTSLIKGYTILTDISQPFAPALKKFTTPLALTVNLSGGPHYMNFSNIHVYTPDKRLSIKATGGITGLGHGMKKDIHFAIHSMHANSGIKEQIIGHFKVKESMLRLIKAAGNITYNGNLHIKEVPNKHIIIGGKLHTQLGLIDFNVNLDQKQKYLTGIAGTEQFAIGQLIDSKDFKSIAFNANFKFNTAGKKAAKELHRHLGKLPIGYIKGNAPSATYKNITLHNLVWDITSDGDMAQGTGGVTGKVADVMVTFSFVDTDFEHSLKFKPSLKLHNFLKLGNKEDKSEKTNKKSSKDNKKDDSQTNDQEPKKKKWQFWKK